ncbi:MAG: tRNA isopentenyl-2-thiomethyl-A-37 hydroxylase MiaE [Polyangiaceae bacterium]
MKPKVSTNDLDEPMAWAEVSVFCLRRPTSPRWVRVAIQDLGSVLADHAHCEVKAATTALSLALKNHEHLGIVEALTELAKEELDHFTRVVSFLERRQLPLGRPPVDLYAARLRELTKALPPSALGPAVDRLLVGALIEARSCERFKLLLDAWPAEEDPELQAFYRELFECEARHYVQYRTFAEQISGATAERIEARLHLVADAEARVIAELETSLPKATVHG